MKRKLFTLLLAAIMAGSALTGCGGDGNSETESSAPEAQSSAAENSEASESGSAAPGELELPIVSDGSVTLTNSPPGFRTRRGFSWTSLSPPSSPRWKN